MTATAVRKTARTHDDDTGPGDGIIRFGDEPEEPRYDTLFRCGGKSYQVLTNPPASLMLAYFDKMRREGVNVAASWALEEMTSPEAYQVLTSDPRVTREGFRQVIRAVMRILLGDEDENAVPKSSNGQRNGRRRSGG